jgi:solute carrier family 25 protein 39/40
MAIPANVIYFTGYDWLRYNRESPIHHYVPDMYAPLAAGSVARVAAAFAVSPIEMFRTRMQANLGSSTTIFMDTFRGLGDVVRAQGVTSLWRGLTLTMWRDVPFSGLYWWGYEAVRNTITDFRDVQRGRVLAERGDRHDVRRRSRSRDNRKTTFVDSFIAGATSGAVASIVTTPFDVGKTRQQVFAHSNDSVAPSAARMASRELLPEERTMPRFLYHVVRIEGISGLFKGWVARCLKVAPACAIMISSYEVGKKMAQRSNFRSLD